MNKKIGVIQKLYEKEIRALPYSQVLKNFVKESISKI